MPKSFADRSGRDLDRAERLVEEALLAGADEAEAYLKISKTQGIQLQARFATLTGGSERGVALRVFDSRGNFGHAFASWTERTGGRALIRTALESLRGAAEGADLSGPTPGPVPGPAPRWEVSPEAPPGLVDERVARWGPAEKRDLIERSLKVVAGGGGIRAAASYRDGISRIALVNSRGVRAAMVRTLALANFTRGWAGGPALVSESVGPGPDPQAIGAAAAELARLDPVADGEAGSFDALLLEPPAALPLMRWLERRLVERGESPEEKFRKLASDAIEVVDDGLLPGGVASAPFDGEGRPTGRLTLVKSGVRIDRLRRPRPGEGGRPGNVVRVSYRDLPVPGATNLFILPGPRSMESIRSDLDRAVLLARLAPEARGDRAGREGRWQGIGWEIRDGGVVGPCRRFIFRADAGRLLGAVAEVGNPVGFSLRRGSALGAPPLLLRGDLRPS